MDIWEVLVLVLVLKIMEVLDLVARVLVLVLIKRFGLDNKVLFTSLSPVYMNVESMASFIL